MLPKIEHPIHNIEIPSTKKVMKFRPFLVKEEKLLLMAKEAESDGDILQAVKQIVNNCAIEKFDVNKLTIFDLEWVFLKLRAVSVDNIAKLSFRDVQDDQTRNFEVHLDTVKIVWPEKTDNIVKLSEKSGIVLKYPTADLYDDKEFLGLEKDQLFELIIRCLDKVYDEDQVFEFSQYKRSEIAEFLDSLNVKIFDEIQNFLINTPRMEHVIEYTNSLGSERKIVLSSLNDFFMWR